MDYGNLFFQYSQTTLERFKKFHAENPQVFEEFKRLAFQMKATGRKKYSAESIVNVIRWSHDLKTNSEEFKINNDFRSIYARLLIHNYPEFKDFFELRSPATQRSA